jgi:cardiolipin synthase
MPAWLNLPNVLTLMRIALAPWVVQAILRGRHDIALDLFIVAAATDGLDGYLARRYGWVTACGAYLDPIADKTLLSGVYVAFAVSGILPWWFVGLIFGRDILILTAAIAALFFTNIRKFPPTLWGKLSTFFQVVTAVTWLARNVLPYPLLDGLAAAMIWPTAAATAWSGIHYGWRGWRLARTH